MILLLILLFNPIYGKDISMNTNNGNIDVLDKIKNIDIEKNKEKEKTDIEKKNNEKKKVKKYSNTPSFLGFGFDLFTFVYNLLTKTNDFQNIKTNKYYDFRFKIDTDFNRIITCISGGYLNWKIKTEDDLERKTEAFFINPNIYYNFFKKNSFRNALYIGGGINFNTTFFTQKSFNDEFEEYNSYKDTSFHLWFNIELGNRIQIVKFLHINANFRITFLNIKLKTITDKSRPEISTPYRLYGFGHTNTSYNVEFCINIIFNIDLKSDVYVIKRESYLYE